MKGLLFAGLLLLGAFANAADIDVNWTAPTENTDGTVLTDLAGFRLFMRRDLANDFGSHVADITDPTQTSLTYSTDLDLEMGQNFFYFVMTAYTAGEESAHSNQILETVVVTPDGPPNPPILEKVQITLTLAVDCSSGLVCTVVTAP